MHGMMCLDYRENITRGRWCLVDCLSARVCAMCREIRAYYVGLLLSDDFHFIGT